MAADVPGLVTYIAQTLADQPDEVEISEYSRGRQRIVHLKVAPDDMGRIIGREGRVANAVRTLLAIVPGEARWRLEVANEEEVTNTEGGEATDDTAGESDATEQAPAD